MLHNFYMSLYRDLYLFEYYYLVYINLPLLGSNEKLLAGFPALAVSFRNYYLYLEKMAWMFLGSKRWSQYAESIDWEKAAVTAGCASDRVHQLIATLLHVLRTNLFLAAN